MRQQVNAAFIRLKRAKQWLRKGGKRQMPVSSQSSQSTPTVRLVETHNPNIHSLAEQHDWNGLVVLDGMLCLPTALSGFSKPD